MKREDEGHWKWWNKRTATNIKEYKSLRSIKEATTNDYIVHKISKNTHTQNRKEFRFSFTPNDFLSARFDVVRFIIRIRLVLFSGSLMK